MTRPRAAPAYVTQSADQVIATVTVTLTDNPLQRLLVELLPMLTSRMSASMLQPALARATELCVVPWLLIAPLQGPSVPRATAITAEAPLRITTYLASLGERCEPEDRLVSAWLGEVRLFVTLCVARLAVGELLRVEPPAGCSEAEGELIGGEAAAAGTTLGVALAGCELADKVPRLCCCCKLRLLLAKLGAEEPCAEALIPHAGPACADAATAILRTEDAGAVLLSNGVGAAIRLDSGTVASPTPLSIGEPRSNSSRRSVSLRLHAPLWSPELLKLHAALLELL